MLKVDYTLIIQIANFLVLLTLLNALLYRPIRNMLRKRQEEMDSFRGVIDRYVEGYDRNTKALEEDTQGARREGHQKKEDIKSEGLEEERGLLHQASSTASERIEKAKQEIEVNVNRVRKLLDEEVSLFSKELAEKVLGRSV